MNKKVLIIAISLMIVAIILGAFGAHGLKELVSPEKVASFETGVKYQIYAALSLLIVAFNQEKLATCPKCFYRLLLGGLLLFSGSIYLLSIQEVIDVKMKFLGPVTPIGGLLMIVSWVFLLFSVLSKKNK